ncbi:thioesterase [Taibaiella lutea]|uniref:Thioesterase n=1 Tax=Taibaiella lutea TaxID=2608001 RepID=A0A5M6CE24_9BACT|nr:thioesterase family protein [Taibaiella lutea]KAA5533428.1 thioesterase [Taibaiella lutea]
MARVKLNFPFKIPTFTTHIPLRITDMNYGNHLGNDAMLSIIHDARMQFLHSLGFTELNINGKGMIMADVMIAYKNEGLYGDVLKIEIYSDNITTRSFDFLYKISTTRNEISIEIAEAKTGMVSYDYELKKICNTPTALLEVLQ